MKKYLCIFLTILLLSSCKSKDKIELVFLDEYIVKDSLLVNNEIVGGLSGLDYANGYYYFVVDDTKTPRFIKAKIDIKKHKISSINFKETILLNDSTNYFYKENALDLESVFVDEETQEINLVSEGSVKRGKLPSVFKTDEKGFFLENFQLPKSLTNLEVIKHNAVFEGSSKSVDRKGFWVSMEGVLKSDGFEPTFHKTSSPVRITYFDTKTKKATKQFAYQLEHITKPSKGAINLNGVTAILEYKENHFFVIERTYQSGYGSYGNIVRVFEASIDKNVTDILKIDSLKNKKFIPLKKKLILNFEDIKDELTEGIVDNIEGITLGPKLENGNQSLILVSDDNFQIYGKQLNQFILLEIKDK